MTTPTNAVFADLLQKAVTEPSTISRSYQQFHSCAGQIVVSSCQRPSEKGRRSSCRA